MYVDGEAMTTLYEEMLLPKSERDRHCKLFDLSGCIQFALIHAMTVSAKAHKEIFGMHRSGGDGFFEYVGKNSIDTSYIAVALALTAREKIAYDEAQAKLENIYRGTEAAEV
jgi:hypothetical protein